MSGPQLTEAMENKLPDNGGLLYEPQVICLVVMSLARRYHPLRTRGEENTLHNSLANKY